ncbi:MAG: amidohydrolase [Chloroflexi bacterium]|nr:amidohydrolase [Chloroflexota bacterium]
MASSDSGELIDWHTHCWTSEYVTDESRATMKAYGVIGGDAWPEHHKSAVVDGGARKFVVINTPTRKGRQVPNDFIAEYVSQYPGRAVGLASVDPHDPGAAKDFERSIKELGLKGLKLSPVYQGFDPWTPQVWRLYEIADDLQVPVMFHMGGAYDPQGTLEWGNPLLLDKVARAFPNLRIIVAHFGQPMMQETVMLMRKNVNVFTDLSARFHRKWQLYNGLQVAIEYKVTDRILFGSDFPVMSTGEAVEAFKNINEWGEGVKLPRIPEELIDEIIYHRPFELLGF